MGIPKEIRLVERPANTVVADTHHEGVNKYAVRQRKGYKNGQVLNGKTIGHIFDGKFVPSTKKEEHDTPSCLSFGGACFAHSVSMDLLDDLTKVFELKQVISILTIASLKVLYPGIKTNRYQTKYHSSFLSIYYPKASISSNSVKSLLDDIGSDLNKRIEFYNQRIARIEKDDHVLVDGTLKQNTSKINDLSDYSRKTRLRGVKDISILYAYNLEKREPICSEVFSGNSLDLSSFKTFIKDNNIKNGIITADKGFPPETIKECIKDNKDIHFLSPLKRNTTLADEYKAYEYNEILTRIEGKILAKKIQMKDGFYLYSFKDSSKAKLEEEDYLKNAKKSGVTFDNEKYKESSRLFGTIILESDYSMSCEAAYLSYANRWKIELVFRKYKLDLELTTTNKQNDFTIIGDEFINFIAATMTCRMVEKAEAANLLDTRSFGNLIDDLNQAWRYTAYKDDIRSGDGNWFDAQKFELKDMEKLGLIKPLVVVPPKKRGRPKSNKPQIVKAKRPRGRPRKNPIEPPKPKRPRGRPRKNPIPVN